MLTNYVDLTDDLLDVLATGNKLTTNSHQLRQLIAKVQNRNIFIDVNKVPVTTISSSENFNQAYVWDTNVVAQLQVLAGTLVNQINRHNEYKLPKRTSDKVFMNFLVNGMFKTYRDVATIGYATLPTTVEPIENAAANSSKANTPVSPFLATSQVIMNANNKVGKKVIGITASAIKAEYAIEYWINSDFKKHSPKSLEITFPGISKTFTTRHAEWSGRWSNVAVLLSSLLSQATDNAKNPILNIINCTSETAPGIIWMMMTGADLNDIVTIFTDPVMEDILYMLRGNFFDGSDPVSITQAINTLIEKNTLRNKQVLDSENHEKLLFYKKVFEGAEELTLLAQELSINQGISTEFGAVANKRLRFEQGIERIISRRLKNFKNPVSNYLLFNKYKRTDGTIRFSKNLFFNNEEYRKDWIRMYAEAGTTVNVLEVLATSPHFFEMDYLSTIAEKAIKQLSGKYRAVISQLNRTKGTNKELVIPKDQLISRLRKLAGNDMIVQAIKTMDFKYASSVILSEAGTIESVRNVNVRSINTPLGLKNFVAFVNEILIPKLKKKYPTNFFLNNLIFDKKYNTTADGYVNYYKPMFNMLEKTNQDYYEKMLIDFNLIAKDVVSQNDLGAKFREINNDNWPSHTVADYMFLYNLIVNQNAIIGSSLSKLFTEVINDSPLIKSYFDFIGNVYDSTYTLDATLKEDFDLLYREKERREDSDYGDYDYADYTDYGDYDSGEEYGYQVKPENVFPLLNARYRELGRKASKQVVLERKLNVAVNRGLLIIKSC